ncbi:MAG TPA: heavy metal-binding domain-containing protein [Planctomycetota bacterium]|nr:heavy metal-binding domain-containing protein [Planctomycetota bacterium]
MRPLIVLVSAAALLGCASRAVVEPPLDHPAHPAAAEAAAEPARAGARPHDASGPARPGVGDDYTCPMHAEVSSPDPGRCPTCGMELHPRSPSEDER